MFVWKALAAALVALTTAVQANCEEKVHLCLVVGKSDYTSEQVTLMKKYYKTIFKGIGAKKHNGKLQLNGDAVIYYYDGKGAHKAHYKSSDVGKLLHKLGDVARGKSGDSKKLRAAAHSACPKHLTVIEFVPPPKSNRNLRGQAALTPEQERELTNGYDDVAQNVIHNMVDVSKCVKAAGP